MQFCGSFKGGADHLGGADVGAGVLQAYCFNFGGCYGGEDLVELGLFQGGQSDISADYLDNGMLAGPDGGLADALWLLEGSDVLECYDGEVLVELELLHGGLPDTYAGDLDIDVLGGLGGGLTEEQQLLADFDKIEGLDGDPPDPGGGACGLRWRVCPLAAWRHGPRGMGSDDGPAEERRLLGDSDALEGCVGGVLGHDLLEDFDGGLTEGQKLLEDFGDIEGPDGDPPDPGGGACGLLRWVCLAPGWRQGLRGVRVGEASHPGPGGGAAATEHRRQEHRMQQALVSIIELLMTVVASLAGENHPVKQQMAGISGLLGVLRAEQEAGQEEERPRHPWRQVQFAPEPHQAEGDLKPLGNRQGQAEPRGWQGHWRIPGRGGRQGQGQERGRKGRQGQGQGGQADPANSVAGPVLVWVRDSEQADALSQMLLGAGAKCTARMVWKAATGTLQIPVERDGDIAVEAFSFVDYTTAGVPPPSFKQAAQTAKKVPKKTVTTTLRVGTS